MVPMMMRWLAGRDAPTRKARRHAISEWMMEVSVLLFVFPLLDILTKGKDAHTWIAFRDTFADAIDIPIVVASIAFSGMSMIVGLYLRVGD